MSSQMRSYDEFEFIKKIGEGGFGTVFFCRDKKFDRDVAIKVVERENSKEELKNVKYLNEISIPCVVKFYGYFTRGRDLYIIMEYCQHGNLRTVINSHIKNETRIDDASIMQWSRELILVMIFMQDNSIVHNDIKPENILLNNEKNSILLADVGEAQFTSKISDAGNKTTVARSGTRTYMAPERKLADGGCSSTASDMWSCGLVYYEFIYLNHPFENVQQFKTGYSIHHDTTGIGAFFKPVFGGTLVLDPEERLSPGRVRLLIIGDSSTNGSAEVELAKILKQPLDLNMKRISDYWPKLETEHYMEIMDPAIIDDAFKMNNLVALVGVGGAGKTTLALEYARRFSRKDESVVVWFYADSMSKMQEKIQSILINDLAIKNEKVSSMNEETRVEMITKHVKKHRGPHLFVFDNIEEEEMTVIEHFSNGIPGNLKILLVTRNNEINKRCKLLMSVLSMDSVSAEQAKQYLVDRVSSRLSAGTVERIFNEVLLTLKIITPFYLKSLVVTLQVFLDQNNGVDSDQLDALINKLKSMDISEHVLNRFMDDENCRRMLERVQFLDPDEISFDVLELLIKPKERLLGAVGSLSKYRIVEGFFIDNKKYIRIHRLIIQSIKNSKRFGDETKRKMDAEFVMWLFVNELENIETVNQKNVKKVKRLQNHIAKLLDENTEANEYTLELYERLILIEETYNFNFVRAVDLRKKMMELSKTRNKKSACPEIARSLEKLGLACSSAGDYSDAMKLHNEALEMRKRIYADEPHHFDIANSLSNLGNVYKDVGEYSKAFELHKEALEMRQAFYKEQPDHPDVARSLNDIGLIHYHLGEYSRAIELHKEALEMRRKFYNEQPDHPDIADSLNNLGEALRMIGSFFEALAVHLETLGMRRRIHVDQPNHPDIATSLFYAGLLSYNCSQFSDAIQFFQESLQIRQEIYKDQPNHPDIATSLDFMGIVYLESEDYSKAFEFHKRVLEMRRAIYKQQPNHPEIATSLNNLGVVYYRRGQVAEAAQCHREALEMRQEVYKSQECHQEIAASLGNLGNTCFENDNPTEALKYHKEALRIRQSVYPGELAEGHPDLAVSFHNLGNTYFALGQHANALECYKDALKVLRKVHSHQPNNMEIVRTLNNMGLMYANLTKENADNFVNAAQCYEESLQLLNIIHKDEPDHKDFSEVLYGLGKMSFAIGSYSRAFELHQRALEIRRVIYKDQPIHHDVADSLNALGMVLYKTDKIDDAIQFHLEALTILRQIDNYSQQNLAIANSLCSLGNAFMHAKDYSNAIECFKEALEKNGKMKTSEQIELNSILYLENLADASMYINEASEALKYLKESLSIKRKMYSDKPENPSICSTLDKMGWTYYRLNDYHEVIRNWNESLQMKSLIHKDEPNHPNIASAFFLLGQAHFAFGNVSEAIKTLESSLDIYRKAYVHEPIHEDIANCLQMLGNAYRNSGNYYEAIKMHREALFIRQKIYGENSDVACIADSFYNLGNSYRNVQNYQTALQCHQRALEIRQNVYKDSPGHPYLESSKEAVSELQLLLTKE